MTDPLADVRCKLRRAHEHYEALNEAVERFLQSDFYRTARKQDRQGRLVERVTEVDPTPRLWGVLISDCAHQFRSVLDHLLFLIARPDEGKEGSVQFPICSSREAWRNARWRMPGTTKDERRTINEVQPYHRRKWPETFVLAQLREINNWDKHRSLLATTAFVEVQQLIARGTSGTSVVSTEAFRGRIKPGAILTRVQPGPSSAGAQMHVQRQTAKLEVFAHRTPGEIRGKPIRTTLANIGNFIEAEVVPRFERLIY